MTAPTRQAIVMPPRFGDAAVKPASPRGEAISAPSLQGSGMPASRGLIPDMIRTEPGEAVVSARSLHCRNDMVFLLEREI
jgi:hypothetical protein